VILRLTFRRPNGTVEKVDHVRVKRDKKGLRLTPIRFVIRRPRKP
jgi:hypothetical protein